MWDRNSMYISMYMMIAENNYYMGIFACARDQLYSFCVALDWSEEEVPVPVLRIWSSSICMYSGGF